MAASVTGGVRINKYRTAIYRDLEIDISSGILQTSPENNFSLIARMSQRIVKPLHNIFLLQNMWNPSVVAKSSHASFRVIEKLSHALNAVMSGLALCKNFGLSLDVQSTRFQHSNSTVIKQKVWQSQIRKSKAKNSKRNHIKI